MYKMTYFEIDMVLQKNHYLPLMRRSDDGTTYVVQSTLIKLIKLKYNTKILKKKKTNTKLLGP